MVYTLPTGCIRRRSRSTCFIKPIYDSFQYPYWVKKRSNSFVRVIRTLPSIFTKWRNWSYKIAIYSFAIRWDFDVQHALFYSVCKSSTASFLHTVLFLPVYIFRDIFPNMIICMYTHLERNLGVHNAFKHIQFVSIHVILWHAPLWETRFCRIKSSEYLRPNFFIICVFICCIPPSNIFFRAVF